MQREAIFNDSKEYVDRPLKADPNIILQTFSKLPDNSSSTLKSFVLNWTNDAGTDLQGCAPPDWVQTPAFITGIKTPALRQWATELHSLWKNLTRRVKGFLVHILLSLFNLSGPTGGSCCCHGARPPFPPLCAQPLHRTWGKVY